MSEVYLPEVERQINQYFEYQPTKALAPGSKRAYALVLRGKLLPFCKERGITELSQDFTAHMDDYVNYLGSQGCGGRTIQGYLTITKLLFRHHGQPIKYTFRIPREEKQKTDLKREKRWFSRRDIALCKTYVFKQNHFRNHALIRLMCETGARLDEIAHIRYEDVFPFENKIRLSVSKTVPRTAKISDETAIYLEQFLAKQYPEPPEDLSTKIFPGKSRIYKLTCEMLQDLGLKTGKDGRGPHTFRHYIATYLYFIRNMPLTDVAFLLGDKPETIRDYYLHPTAEMLHSRMAKAAGY